MLTGGTHRASYSDLDAMPRALDNRLAGMSPLRGKPFLLESIGIGLGDVAVRVGRNSPLLVQGRLPPNMVSAFFPLTPDPRTLISGHGATPDMMAIYGAGALYDGANHTEASWAVVVMHASVAARLFDRPGRSPILPPGAHAVLACDPEVWRQAILLLRSAEEVAVQDPAVFEVAEARRSLRASVLEVLQDLLTGAWGGGRPRILRASPGRQRLVHAIEDHLNTHPGQAATADSLAAALGASVPRLRRAVTASFGISLQRYLLLRRLTLFRAALRAAGRRDGSAREIALAHGFLHLERLGQDYHAVFSEDLHALLEEGATPRRRDMPACHAEAG